MILKIVNYLHTHTHFCSCLKQLCLFLCEQKWNFLQGSGGKSLHINFLFCSHYLISIQSKKDCFTSHTGSGNSNEPFLQFSLRAFNFLCNYANFILWIHQVSIMDSICFDSVVYRDQQTFSAKKSCITCLSLS